jgi:4-amino-4-deoxy-L-arabinose transferase-like glycosyltransferase
MTFPTASEIVHALYLTLSACGWIGLFAIAIFGYGITFIELLRPSLKTQLAAGVFAFALGWGTLAHLTLIAGAIHGFGSILPWVLLGLGWFLALISGNRAYKKWRTTRHEAPFRVALFWNRVWKPSILSLFLTVFAIIIIANLAFSFYANGLLPPTSNDEVAYHLAIPKIYVQNQGITYISFIPYSNWPLETEMLFSLSLLAQGDLVAHLLTWSAGVIVSLGIISFGKRFFGYQAGLLGAAIFSATPVFRYLSGTGLIEVPLTLFFLTSIYAFFIWIETRNHRDLVLSAICAGLAASTKLNAAVLPLFIAITACLIVFFSRSRSISNSLRTFVFYGCISFFVVLPWYLKSWVLTGNPLWPFLPQIFGSRGWDALGTQYLLSFIQLPNLPITLPNWFSAAWILAFPAGQFGPPNFRIGWLYLLLFPLVGLGSYLARAEDRKWILTLAGGCLILYTSWFLQTHQSRFLLPALPIFAVSIAAGFMLVTRRIPKLLQPFAWLGILGTLLACFWAFSPQDFQALKSASPFLAGREDRNTYLARLVPGFEVYLFANQNLPSDGQVWLALYESRGYYLDMSYEWANPISQRIFPLESYETPDDLAAALYQNGFRYIIFRESGLEKYTYIPYGQKITALVQDMISTHTQLIYQKSELALYELTR